MNPTLSVVLVHRNDFERAQLQAAFEALPNVQIAERALRPPVGRWRWHTPHVPRS